MSRPEDTENNSGGNIPAAVVWDLDGTLVESAPDLANALNAILAEKGLAPRSVDAVRMMIGAGVPKLIERGFRAAGAPLDEAELNAVVPRFMERYLACATDNTYLIDGARDVLEQCRLAGLDQGLCTNKPEAVTRKILAKLGVDHDFGGVRGGDSTPARKPDPLPLLTCLEGLGASPAKAVMVGDSGADVGAAKAAGVRILLVPDGYTGVTPESLGADRVVENLADVPRQLSGRKPN